MFSMLRSAAVLLMLFTLLTGVAYPIVVTASARLLFPRQAAGSLLHSKGRLIGSSLVGQPFDDLRYFWGRPSATMPFPYNASSSNGSNLGPSNPALIAAVRERVALLRAADPTASSTPIPVDLVTASASGLDPHISPAAALYQAHRVALARAMDEDAVRALVLRHVEARTWGFLGEPRVNVLALNMALDALAKAEAQPHQPTGF